MGIDGITITQLATLLLGEVAITASPNSKPDIVPPDLCSIFDHMKRNIYCDINKVSIGKIRSFDASKQTAQIELVFMRVIGTELMKYPTLVDVPCVCLRGGQSRITFPIVAGDTALVLFCDRDIDNWFAGADLSAPNSERLHDLSDGIAIVGLGPALSGYNQSGPELKQGSDGTIKIESTGPQMIKGQRMVRVQSDGVKITDGTFTLREALDALFAGLDSLCTALTLWQDIDTRGDTGSPTQATLNLINLAKAEIDAAKVTMDGIMI